MNMQIVCQILLFDSLLNLTSGITTKNTTVPNKQFLINLFEKKKIMKQ